MIVGFQPCLSEFYTRLVVSNSQKGRALTFLLKWLTNYLLTTSITSSTLNSHKASLRRYLLLKTLYTLVVIVSCLSLILQVRLTGLALIFSSELSLNYEL